MDEQQERSEARNHRICRRHLWITETCSLCGMGDQHRHCYSDWHVCPYYGPLEHDAPRKAAR